VDGRSRLRRADGEAADRTGAEDEGNTRQGFQKVTVTSLKWEVRSLTWMLVLALVVGAAASARAQRGGVGLRGCAIPVEPNPPYDGRFTFIRLRYGPPMEFISQRIPWSHDYPAGERHFMKILNELSLLNPHMAETSILGFDQPEIFKYPVSYMAE